MATSQAYTSVSGITVSLLLSSFVAFLHSSEVKACVTSLVAGGATTCVVITDSTAGSSKGKCWGVNTFGRLGLGDTNSRGDDAGEMGMLLPTIDVGTSKTIVQFAPGFQHTCARLNDNTVKCWGYNNLGQLGQGDTEDRGDASGEMGIQLPIVNLGSGLTAKSISAGTGFTCVILNNNNVKCWGANPFGELGLGDTLNRGNVTGQMGDSLAVVDIGTSIKAVEIRAGGYHVCVRTQTSNKLKCWGGNHFGQLGLGDTNHRGDEVNEMGTNLPFVDLGTVSTIKQVAVGDLFTCALLTDDSIKCFGYNGEGQLGQGVDNQPIGTQSGEMGDDLVATDLGSVTPDTLVCGADHCCSLLTPKGTGIKCWGNNNKGRLGYGDTNNRGDNAGEMGDDLQIVDVGTDIVPLEVAAGGTHTCVRIEGDIDLLCWGNGAGGRLGRGNQLVIGDGAGEMGDDLDYTQVCPTAAPTQEPTDSPTRNPTKRPTTSPTETGVTLSPTKMPTSKSPTKSPTNKPVLSPTTKPSKNPTKAPVTPSPSKAPIKAPSKSPSASPTKKPSVSPSTAPTVSPTTVSPTDAPVTPAPSKAPVTPEPTIPGATISPSLSPSKSPTKTPTTQTPTKDPTESPTKKPSVSPTKKPSVAPSKSPSSRPTKSPIKGATSSPTIAPLAICNTTNKKKCVKDTRCLWVKVKKQSTCTLFSCSSLSKKKCKKDARCTLSGATCVSAT